MRPIRRESKGGGDFLTVVKITLRDAFNRPLVILRNCKEKQTDAKKNRSHSITINNSSSRKIVYKNVRNMEII